MTKNSSVPTPEKKIVVVGGMCVSTGTTKVAPNIAITCCMPMPIVRDHDRRSSGATTSVKPMCFPSPWTVHR